MSAIRAVLSRALAAKFSRRLQSMNVNEVLANRAAEILGSPRGDYERVHPNDHVNMRLFWRSRAMIVAFSLTPTLSAA